MLKKFTGDHLEWKMCQETYRTAIRHNDSLSEVEKFTCSQGYLEGIAFQAIEGFPLTCENYKHVWELLKERYRNPQFPYFL